MANEEKMNISDNNEINEENIDQTVENESVEQNKEENVASNETVSDANDNSAYEKLKLEHSELHDKYLRLYSDFENFRRRTNKEKADLIDMANERLILEILPVVDDFERAMQSMKNSNEVASVYEGVSLIFNKLIKTINSNGVSEIDCIEKEFDPDIHEAITKIPAPKKKLKGKVVDQIQKGYMLKEKVIRHSKVIVGE